MIETWIVKSGSASIKILGELYELSSLRFFNHEMGTLTLCLFLEVEWKLNDIHVKQFYNTASVLCLQVLATKHVVS